MQISWRHYICHKVWIHYLWGPLRHFTQENVVLKYRFLRSRKRSILKTQQTDRHWQTDTDRQNNSQADRSTDNKACYTLWTSNSTTAYDRTISITQVIEQQQIKYQFQDWIGLCSVLCPRQHSIGYMGDGFYRSKDPTNSIKVLKENLQRKNQTTKTTKYICIDNNRHKKKGYPEKNTTSPLVYTNMGWLGDGSHRGQVRQASTAVGLPPQYPSVSV